MLFFRILLPALVVLTGCVSSHRQLDPLLASRMRIRTLKVAETKCWAREYVEGELLAYLKGCGAHVEAGTETADLVIRWQEEQCGVCLDFCAPSCDVLKLKADLETVDGAHATWIRRLPIWCAEEEQCLLKLFARDLGALLCRRPRRDFNPGEGWLDQTRSLKAKERAFRPTDACAPVGTGAARFRRAA